MRRSAPEFQPPVTYGNVPFPEQPGWDGNEVAWHPDGEDVPRWFWFAIVGTLLGLLTVVLLWVWPIVIDPTPHPPVHTPTTYGPPPTATLAR